LKVYGLTGGIASGKSTAAKFFAEAGIPVMDADQITRELSQPGGAAHPLILKEFGTDDRNELRQKVFSDPEARKKLEKILHPLIQGETQRRILELSKKNPPFMIYEAALLVETGRHQNFDGLIVVDAPRDKRKSRLRARDGHPEEFAEKILNSQISDEERKKPAQHILNNSKTVEDLKAAVINLISNL